jgi:predicted TIM-barrel fold metal-dependent hydrolase
MDRVAMAPGARAGMTPDAFVKVMDEAGVGRAFLIAARAGDLRVRGSFEVPYAAVEAACAAHPSRYSGLAGIDPTRGLAGLRDLDAAARAGFVGAHLYPHRFGIAPDHRTLYPYYARGAELGLPIQIQVGHALIYDAARPMPSTGRPDAIDRIACDMPELTIVAAHIGVPWEGEMISVAAKHPNVFIATDAHAPHRWPEALLRFLDGRLGRGKVLFGTDWPVVDPRRARRDIDAMDLKPESRDALLRGAAARIYRLHQTTAETTAPHPDPVRKAGADCIGGNAG